MSRIDKGRYVIVKGFLYGQTILILNMYFPPAHPPDFLTKVFLDFSVMTAEIVIVGGDFNCILNPLIDRCPHSTKSLTSQAKSLLASCEDLGLVDVWRSFHPAGKEYTFFSAPHGCHTRMDYFFLPRTNLYIVLFCRIGSILISDHACVVMDIKLKSTAFQSRHYTILKDVTFMFFLC